MKINEILNKNNINPYNFNYDNKEKIEGNLNIINEIMSDSINIKNEITKLRI